MTTDIPTLLAAVDLFAQVERDGTPLHGNDREKHGSCPKGCGNPKSRVHDSFRVQVHNGRHYFACRHCHTQPGDAIEYMCWRHGMMTGDAIRALGGDTITRHPARPAAAQPEPMPDEFPPCERWQCKARTFADACAAKLWTPEGARALAYLRGRGLSDDTIRAAGLGFNPATRYAAGRDWGLTDREKVTAIRGITIPCRAAGWLWSVNIRRLNEDGSAYSGPDKYFKTTGSIAALYGADALHSDCTALLCEGEFDTLLAQQHAPPGLVAVTFGSAGKAPSLRWRIALRGLRLLLAFDRDGAGAKGAAKWAELGTRVSLPGDGAKDITDFTMSGGDVRAWLAGQVWYDGDAARYGATCAYLFEHGYDVRVSADGYLIAEIQS